MGQPTEVALRPHHGYQSWSSFWYGPDRDEKGQLRRHCKRFGREDELSKKAAVLIFRRWLTEAWEPRYGKGKDSEVLKPPVHTVEQLAKDYFAHVQKYHRKGGEPTSYVGGVGVALRVLCAKIGGLDVNAVTAPILATLRDGLLTPNRVGKKTGKRRSGNLTLRTATMYLTIIKAAFRWGRAERGIVSAPVAADVMQVAPLKRGKCDALEKAPIRPVAWECVQKTCGKLPDNLAAMVKLQWHTGMRPGEVRIMRPCDVETGGEVWQYVPSTHKTEHKGRSRRIALGPEAQKVLAPFLNRQTTAFCFAPKESRDKLPHLICGDLFGPNQYRHLIRNAARKAKVEEFHPHRLRHSWATRVAAEFGIEAAADGLGHASLNTALIYAERSFKRAAEVAKMVG